MWHARFTNHITQCKWFKVDYTVVFQIDVHHKCQAEFEEAYSDWPHIFRAEGAEAGQLLERRFKDSCLSLCSPARNHLAVLKALHHQSMCQSEGRWGAWLTHSWQERVVISFVCVCACVLMCVWVWEDVWRNADEHRRASVSILLSVDGMFTGQTKNTWGLLSSANW